VFGQVEWEVTVAVTVSSHKLNLTGPSSTLSSSVQLLVIPPLDRRKFKLPDTVIVPVTKSS
jgi:hypothetical protein